MRRILWIGLLCLNVLLPVSASGQEESQGITATALRSLFSLLSSRLDEIANTSSEERSQLREELGRLDGRIEEFRAFEIKLEGLEKRLIATEQLRQEMATSIRISEELTTSIAAIKTNIDSALSSAQDAKSSAASTAWILTVVSSIVSILVIIIGLFFSSKFMQLHAENQVSKALLERIERKVSGNKIDGAAS